VRASTAPVRRRSPIAGAAAAPGRALLNSTLLNSPLLGPALLGAAGLAAVAVLATVDPEVPGHYPVCPTYALTGLYCPGCGGLRAAHALTQGDLGLALRRNPLVVLGVPVAVWAYLAWVRRRALGRTARRALGRTARRALGRTARRVPSVALGWGAGALVMVWVVLRNVPAFAWLAP
jgi:hypothetical protein